MRRACDSGGKAASGSACVRRELQQARLVWSEDDRCRSSTPRHLDEPCLISGSLAIVRAHIVLVGLRVEAVESDDGAKKPVRAGDAPLAVEAGPVVAARREHDCPAVHDLDGLASARIWRARHRGNKARAARLVCIRSKMKQAIVDPECYRVGHHVARLLEKAKGTRSRGAVERSHKVAVVCEAVRGERDDWRQRAI